MNYSRTVEKWGVFEAARRGVSDGNPFLERTIRAYFEPWTGTSWDEVCGVPQMEFMKPVKSYYLFYYSFMRPSFRDYYFDDETEYEVKVIDTWEITVTDAGTHKGHFRVALPGKSYMAVQIRKKR